MTVIIRVSTIKGFDTEESREKLAVYVSARIDDPCGSHVPYRANVHDSYEWIVDRGNDWRVQFDVNDPMVFRLWHRYNHARSIMIISQFLGLKLDARVIELSLD